jgi:hypothetical protein
MRVCRVHEEIARFKGSKLDRNGTRSTRGLDRTSHDYETATPRPPWAKPDAEVELDVRFENKGAAKSAPVAFIQLPDTVRTTFTIGKLYGLEIYNPVDSAGRFIPEVEPWGGEDIFEANPKIVEFCGERDACSLRTVRASLSALLALQESSGFRATPQWFISIDEVGGEARRKACVRRP